MNNEKYLHENSAYILIAALAFVGSALAGYYYSAMNPEFASMGMNQFETSFGWIKGLGPLTILLIVFLNNAIKAFFALILGLGFAIIPIGFLTLNGIMIGLVSYQISNSMGWTYLLAGIGPHGIIEIPMLILSAAIGIRLGHLALITILGEQTNLKEEVRKAVRFYSRLILPLLLLASAIEALITPLIISGLT